MVDTKQAKLKMDLDRCSVCLIERALLINVNKTDLNNIKFSTKIISIVPELVIIYICRFQL